jgi:polyvinyl alcohol dehydrogenase (cytochrome)
LTGLLSTTGASGGAFINWSRYLYTTAHSSDNSAATAITTSNAAGLKQVWNFVPPPPPVEGLAGFYSSPTVYDGVIYIGARNGFFYAISESTGKVIWQRFIGYLPEATCAAEGFTSTATVATDPATGHPVIYVYGPTGYLYAMETSDGANAWPPAKVAVPSTTVSDYYAWASPVVADGNVYVGISSNCDRPEIRGGLAEFSADSGNYENTFWTDPPGQIGASIWSTEAFDGSSLYVSTGNGSNGSDAFSIIKLSRSMALQGIWTVPPAQRVPDSDFGASPGIWTATIGGTPTEMVGACNKNGIFYAFRAADIDAGPVWKKRIANPFTTGPGECDAAPLWDGTHLYLASSGTVIHGTGYDGSVEEVNPATGAFIWQRGVTGAIIGTPAMDGSDVIAAASYVSPTDQNGVWLINDTNGKILETISYGASQTFGQPVFADNYLLVASGTLGLTAYALG